MVRLGEFAGIAVYVRVTFLLLVGWVALSHWITGRSLAAVLAGVGFLAPFGCMVLHEFGHALTARRSTLPVTHNGRLIGLVTMDNVGEFVMVQAAVSARAA